MLYLATDEFAVPGDFCQIQTILSKNHPIKTRPRQQKRVVAMGSRKYAYQKVVFPAKMQVIVSEGDLNNGMGQ